MQLKYSSILAFCIALFSALIGADHTQKQDIDVDFLWNYYQQDGEHSAVTGGIGTEELWNTAPTFIVRVPFGDHTLTTNLGVDAYSSASSNNIDPIRSGASESDVRTHLDVGLSVPLENNRSVNYSFSASTEYDYTSIAPGIGFAKSWNNGNSEFSAGLKTYFDLIHEIYPKELRDLPDLESDPKRQTYNVSLGFSQVINQRLQLSLATDLVYQSGYLSSTFNRVYFIQETALPGIEQLPDKRFKYPLGIRLNYYVSELMVLRFYGRYYADDWGIRGSTLQMEVPLRFHPEFTFTPFFRFHNQVEADYFAPYGENDNLDEFYTSDYDLSGFSSSQYGLGIRYYPFEAISSFGLPFSNSRISLKKIELRGSQYSRDDGLDAFNIALGMSFTIPRK